MAFAKFVKIPAVSNFANLIVFPAAQMVNILYKRLIHIFHLKYL